METLNNFDFKILNFIYDNLKCDFLDKSMPLVSKLGDVGLVFIIIAIIFICIKKYRKVGITMLISLVIGLILGNLIMKPLFARVRPYDIATTIKLIVAPLNDFSFPSGHTLAAVECAVAIFLLNKKLSIPFIIFSIIMAFSRLYLYVHYPSDIIGSIIIGLFIGYLAYIIVNRIYKKDK